MSTVTVTYEIEPEDGFVLLLVTRQSGSGSHSEGIRIPFDQIAEAIQALTSATWDVEHASSATETENSDPCEIVFDGTDTNDDVWNRCTVHGYLVFGDAPLCEGYRAPAYIEKS